VQLDPNQNQLNPIDSKFLKDQIRALLGYYAAYSGKSVPTFRDNLSVPCPEVQEERLPNTTPDTSINQVVTCCQGAIIIFHVMWPAHPSHRISWWISQITKIITQCSRSSCYFLLKSKFSEQLWSSRMLSPIRIRQLIAGFSIRTTFLLVATEKILEAEGPSSPQDVNFTRRWRKNKGEPQWQHAPWLTARATPF
jgi:hypothetical protein